MAASLASIRVECRSCAHSAVLSGAMVEARTGAPLTMLSVGRLLDRLRCSSCSGQELRIVHPDGRILVDTEGATHCAICGGAIPLPRLRALPSTKTCADCATARSARPADPPYPQPPADLAACPRCRRPTVVRENADDGSFFLGCTAFPRCRWSAPLPPQP